MKITLTVEEKFIGIFECDLPCMIIYGGVCTGKFYAGCQKIVIECLKNKINCAIFSSHIGYCVDIIFDILKGYGARYIKSLDSFDFPNGSYIDIYNHKSAFLELRKSFYVYSMLKDPLEEIFDKFKKITLQQTIITCHPPEETSFIHDLSKKENCAKVSSGSALDSPYLSGNQKELLKQYDPT